ncbi:hypothetical protein [Candidatus Mycoplasma haematominutum]|uniref:Uncharacterized protein n=1 Tax=Candidatus Mycoplasma haematominutum 'Birmingham 1' TaxID=1116213 RepID=G8C3P8_9MOLU|nr:hypothetical protein [Candidatus Mycoplasma haematominutum]CCE66946.1 hypothetical protein MHM_04280 [Candidatus Mycoplasma haematominutum 'Birmingham 1']
MVNASLILKGALGLCSTAGAVLAVAAPLGTNTSVETGLTQVDRGNSENKAAIKALKFSKCGGSN